MHITKIELEDIKSHVDSKYEFTRGTTAITGENGAGKTTLIEAIAWTLFDLLEYKKDDFVRRGAVKGVARVTFESGLDEREYTVYRDTATGYYVYDPRLKTRIADKKEEVSRFLWQHLGVEPGTDLESLFKHAIGVPQGAFTASFLATSAERKKTFDTLLKVEEYRRGADELLKTSRYLEHQITTVRERIARAEGELARTDSITADYKKISSQAGELAKNLEIIVSAVADKSESAARMDEIADKVEELRSAFEKLKADTARLEILFAQKERDLKSAALAVEKIKEAESDNRRHLAALSRLKELERERVERDKLRIELAKVETAIANVKAEQKRLQENLETVLKAHQTIEILKPKVLEQERLEMELDAVRNKLAHARAFANQILSLEEKLARLRESYTANQDKLKEIETKTSNAANLNELQKRDSEIVLQLAQLRASLERDEKFQAEIKNGLCPILSQKCLNLKEGETLESYVTSQFSELKSQILDFEIEQKAVATNLLSSRDAERFVSTLGTYQARAVEITEEGRRLNSEKAALEKESENLPNLDSEFARIEKELAVLDNPKAGIKILEKEATREFELREAVTKIDKNNERLETDRQIFVEQLESYKDLDAQWEQFSGERDSTVEAHRIYLSNEVLANSLAERGKDCEEAKRELDILQDDLVRADRTFNETGKGYDRELHLTEKAKLLEAEKRKAEVGATFEAVKRRENELAAELATLNETRNAMQGEFIEKERLEKIAEATTFIRETLKEAAPRVARNYVHHVSIEANQMFREISGNAEYTLKWGEDYGIFLEEGGYDRPFISLSGGEQMAAALSVRLALLKQLSEIRIAFFDEPTANMDAERRENFAMQISQIKHFEQLFVISHDDTFENYADNVLSVERGVNV